MKFLPWGKKDKPETLPVPYERPTPPPPVLQRYAVERISDTHTAPPVPVTSNVQIGVIGNGNTINIGVGSKQAGNAVTPNIHIRVMGNNNLINIVTGHGSHAGSYGEVLPRVDTSPTVIEMLTLHFMCSHFRKPFTGVYGKSQIGVPYRLMLNVLPHEAAALLHEAGQRGIRIQQTRQGIVPLDDLDLCNWQCLHCGHGKIQGDRDSFFFCFQCVTLQCGSSIVYPRNATATVFCIGCNRVYPLSSDTLQVVAGTKQLIQRH